MPVPGPCLLNDGMEHLEAAETAAADPTTRDRKIRKGAAWALGLLLPTLVVAVVLALFTPGTAWCITHGPCDTVVSGSVTWYLLMASAAFGALAVSLPRRHLPFESARSVLLKVQVGTQSLMVVAAFDALGGFVRK